MSALLFLLFLSCGILLAGNGLPYGNLFSKYENRDDYYEDYYLRKIPKLKTSPDKVKEFFINHLSWFPVDDLVEIPTGDLRNIQNRQSLFLDLQLEDETTEMSTTTTSNSRNITGKVKEKFKKIKNFTENHHGNWTKIKSKSVHKVKTFVEKKHMKEKLKNVTHPLRYRGPMKHHFNHSRQDCYKNLGPSGIRIHPKSSHVEVIKNPSTTTPFPFIDTHLSFPRKMKVIIDLNPPSGETKLEGTVKNNLVGLESDTGNSTKVLETAGEVASDLAGRVSSLWHSVLGTHHLPDTRDVKFYLYTRRNVIQPELLTVNYDLINRKIRENPQFLDVECVDLPPEEIAEFERVSDENRNIIKSNFLNLKAPTKIIIHGYTGSYKDSRMAKIKDAYLTNGRYNVIQVDWEMLAAPPCYIRVTHHSKFVGETIARFLDGLYLVGLNMSLVHLVGFSLGAQVAGFVGNNATKTPICRITGLDPALPLFLHTEPSGHLDKMDAKFVDVIHTCGGILAMLDPLGHVDFYPNGGTRQPGCEFSNLKCSHSRAPQYFAESVISEKRFTGQLCLSWEEYVEGKCDNNTKTSFMGEPCSRRKIKRLATKIQEQFLKTQKLPQDRMPPPNPSCSQVNTRSTNDQRNFENGKNCGDEVDPEEDKCNFKGETLTLVKSLLGPSLESTVLKTLEFGKSLIQGADGANKACEEVEKPQPKEITAGESSELNIENLLEKGVNKDALKGILSSFDKDEKKQLKLLYNINKQHHHHHHHHHPPSKPNSSVRKHVSKIRSLDSDLKRSPPSPENIKKQLEALIQITKNESPKQSWTVLTKTSKLPVEMTVMPSLCMYKNEADMNYSSSCDVNSKVSNECECSASKSTPMTKKRNRNKICQAPEFISNALGPTIDVSIIDNLKMMRNLFSSDSGRGEGCVSQVKQEIRLQSSEGEMESRIDVLQRKIEELEEKEQCLRKQIEEEEQQMNTKRKEFEEEEKRMCEKKACFDAMEGIKKKSSGKCLMDVGFEGKYENVKAKVAVEEEKLSRLKCQFDQYKSDLAEAKMKKEALKRNKCLLDAWDVFASRVCHTKLPSYTRAYRLERKQFQSLGTANLHCCLPPINSPSTKQVVCKGRCGAKSQSGDSHCDTCSTGDGKSTKSSVNLQEKIKMGDVQFPIQRDIVCGLHQMMKTCNCSRQSSKISRSYSSEDESCKKSKGTCKSRNRNVGTESSTEMVLRTTCGGGDYLFINKGGDNIWQNYLQNLPVIVVDKQICRAKSDTSLKNEKCSKIIKVMWAVARINIFQNNFRTYEILEATSTPPCKIPNKTEGIFVVKSQKKPCPSPPRKNCPPKPSRY